MFGIYPAYAVMNVKAGIYVSGFVEPGYWNPGMYAPISAADKREFDDATAAADAAIARLVGSPAQPCNQGCPLPDGWYSVS